MIVIGKENKGVVKLTVLLWICETNSRQWKLTIAPIFLK